MKLKWSDSALFTSNESTYDKEFIRTETDYLQGRLMLDGHLFLNSALLSLGYEEIKRGQLDGWLWDRDDPAGQIAIKIKTKVENGELYLVLNEEKNIIDHAFLN